MKAYDTMVSELTELRFIPIRNPSVAGGRIQSARTDDEEAAIRAEAMAQGLVAGTAMRVQPNPGLWRVINYARET
jgi:hypothetical protein